MINRWVEKLKGLVSALGRRYAACSTHNSLSGMMSSSKWLPTARKSHAKTMPRSQRLTWKTKKRPCRLEPRQSFLPGRHTRFLLHCCCCVVVSVFVVVVIVSIAVFFSLFLVVVSAIVVLVVVVLAVVILVIVVLAVILVFFSPVPTNFSQGDHGRVQGICQIITIC